MAGKTRYYWYAHVKRTIERYPDGLDRSTNQGAIAYASIERVIADTQKLQDGKERLELVKMLCWDKSHTIEGAAHVLHVGDRTAHRWWHAFIYAVAKEIGFY